VRITAGTHHMTVADFRLALADTKPGDTFIYATGDLMFSCDNTDAKSGLLRMTEFARAAYEDGEVTLTQRRRADIPFTGGAAGASFEYRATKLKRVTPKRFPWAGKNYPTDPTPKLNFAPGHRAPGRNSQQCARIEEP
jgi:hypothetical protein